MGDAPTATGGFSAAPSGPPAASLIGEVLDGRYRIIKLIGEGGMGEVYAAEHVHIDKKFAIKLLRSEIVSNPEAVTRFRQEAQSSSSIKHRNIIAIDDFGTLADGRIYMCMELLNGAPLNDMIRQPMAVDRLLNILIQSGHGLGAAHAKGIIHRDMKPENIFVTIGPNGEDVPKLLDFGIAKVSGNDGQNHLTRTGTIFGTPFYMAPEQALGNPVDARTDIYAVGVIMYEVFAGSLPFQGESFMGILTQHITTEPEPVEQRAAKAGRSLPHGLADIVTRCMQKNPAQRFSTMDEVVGGLVEIYRGIAGAGMSTYMAAFSGAQHPSQPVLTPPVGHATGAPLHGQGATGSAPMQIPGTAGVTAQPVTGPHAVALKKKSKAGVIIAVLAVVLVGGGVAAIAMVGKGAGNKSGSGSGSGSAIAIAPPNTGSGSNIAKVPDKVPDKGSDSGNGSNQVAANGSNGSNGSDGTPPKLTPDAGVVVAVADAAAETPSKTPDAAVVATVEKVPVVINARGVGAFEVWEDGKKLFDGPDEIQIGPGEKHTLVVKARGFHDKPITVDNSQHKVFVSLERIAQAPPPPPPVKTDCFESLRNPKDVGCRRQFCQRHRHDSREQERRCDFDDE